MKQHIQIHLRGPGNGWTALLGCREYGRIGTYGTEDIHGGVRSSLDQVRLHDDASLFLVEFECAKTDCRSPTKLHVDMRSGGEAGLLALLRRGFFFGGLPCGHILQKRFAPIPKVRRILERLW